MFLSKHCFQYFLLFLCLVQTAPLLSTGPSYQPPKYSTSKSQTPYRSRANSPPDRPLSFPPPLYTAPSFFTHHPPSHTPPLAQQSNHLQIPLFRNTHTPPPSVTNTLQANDLLKHQTGPCTLLELVRILWLTTANQLIKKISYYRFSLPSKVIKFLVMSCLVISLFCRPASPVLV